MTLTIPRIRSKLPQFDISHYHVYIYVSKINPLCGENDIVKFCKLSRLRQAGYVIRQDDDDDLSRRVLLSEPEGKRPKGRPRLRWEDGVEEDVARLGCRNWKVVALNREGWRKLLKEAEAHPGLQRRWREREREYMVLFLFNNVIYVFLLL